jgi:PST family polysaccharide transporter
MRDILKAGFKVGLATLAGLLGWVVAGKVLAVTLGAAGVGLFGLLRQLLQNLTLVGSFNGQTALVQGIASRTSESEQVRFAGTVLKIQVVIVGTVALGLLFGAPWLGPWLIPHPQAVSLLRWLALAMLVMVAQTYVIGLLNGHRLINELVKSQMLGSLAVLSLVFPMIWLVRKGDPSGFVLMLGGPAMAVTLAAGWANWRAGWLPVFQKWSINRADGAIFFRMSAIMLIAGMITTGTRFFMSWLVTRRIGLAEAGQFWTAWTLSMTYVTLVLGSLGTYYMPSLSRISDPEGRRALILNYLRLALIAMPLLVSMVIVFKPWIIRGMFSLALLPALKVMRWMLIGDLFKGVSWVLAFPMLAFSEMKWFFWAEAAFSIAMAGTAWLWLSLGGGIEGLGFIFMVLYILYLPAMAMYIRVMHGFLWKAAEVRQFVAALVLVILLSVFTWRAEVVGWETLILFAVLSGVFTTFSLRGIDWRTLWYNRKKIEN